MQLLSAREKYIFIDILVVIVIQLIITIVCDVAGGDTREDRHDDVTKQVNRINGRRQPQP